MQGDLRLIPWFAATALVIAGLASVALDVVSTSGTSSTFEHGSDRDVVSSVEISPAREQESDRDVVSSLAISSGGLHGSNRDVVSSVEISPAREQESDRDVVSRDEISSLDGHIEDRRTATLAAELALRGENPVGRWYLVLGETERPAPNVVRTMVDFLADYPVELAAHEGLWVAARIVEDDWLDWAPTIDEALIQYLGPARLVRELPQDVVEALREDWSEEGFFER